MQMHQLDARIRRMLDELRRLTVRSSLPVQAIRMARRGETETVPFENGAVWGLDGEWWDFFFSATVPDDFHGRVILKIRTGREAEWEAVNPQFVARVNGRIEQAFDTRHTSLTLAAEAKPGETFSVVLNGYAPPPDPHKASPVLEILLQDINEPVQQLVYDIAVPHEAALLIPAGERERETTLEILARALDLLDLRAPHSPGFDASVEAARAYLKEAYYGARAALAPIAKADCVGHTHIDVAWLWDLYQTRHKTVRSFATVLKLMELYPEYKFMSSQAALYNMVKQDEPELFARIKEAVAAGRWEVEGGMWVEADCNLASGESLARQFLHGQNFFTREFGKRSRILWLPDVFGYSAALPQILKLSGIDYFMTTKLSWSEFNLSPYDTFTWKGLDGSEVLTHFSPARDFVGADTGHETHDALPYFTTYNAMLQPTQIAGGWQRFQQKGLDDTILVSYGYGDGGGGPTDWMIENARRMTVPLPATPVVRQAHARPFFEALEQRVLGDPRLPKWSGELYLEYHRGTYTAMARNKRSNRKIELLLREVELWRAAAAQNQGFPYPAGKLREIWEDVLTLQFHDILPGSSIKKVYDDSEAMYARRMDELETLRDEGIAVLAGSASGNVLAFNSLAHARDDVVWFDAPAEVTALKDASGAVYPVQHVPGRGACAFVRNIAPMAATPLWFSGDPVSAEAVHADTEGFATPFFTGTFDAAMRITSLTDKGTGREVVKPGEALNRIVCYENKPHNYDAWDINIYYDRRHWDVDAVQSVSLISAGPVLALLRVDYRYMGSTILQDILVYRDIGRVDFDTTVDWREQQYLLKAHFPVDVFYNEATYDVQYGNVRRSTHKNTAWDIARFEVCAHKWVDASEDGFGVSLLNDCKYGHSIDENSMALTLLKSSTHPNPDADQETHRFTYSLMPHAGGWRDAGTPEMAYRLNVPVTTAEGKGADAAPGTFVGVDAPNVVVEAVKAAEDGNGVIVRVYECYGRRTDAALTIGFDAKSAEVVNLLEETMEAAAIADGKVSFAMRPYEIKSFRVV